MVRIRARLCGCRRRGPGRSTRLDVCALPVAEVLIRGCATTTETTSHTAMTFLSIKSIGPKSGELHPAMRARIRPQDAVGKLEL